MTEPDIGGRKAHRRVNWVEEASTGFERGRGPWARDRRFEPQRAVRWMALGQLGRTGVHVVVSKIFGQYSDRRESFAFVPEPAASSAEPAYFDHRAESTTASGSPEDPYWFDYVADVGDGFPATFAVAEQLGAERVVLPGDGDADPTVLPRGRLLVMGGDEVYPLPTGSPERDAYRDRLTGPYEAALQNLKRPHADEDDEVLHLYAIPGNHDWYDGLGAFVKRFCSNQWIGAWKTRQRRSYFALRLPHGWWLWAIDAAFEGPMDDPQLRYFQEIGQTVGAHERVIICTAYPRWLKAGPDGDRAYSLLRGFVRQTLREKPHVVRLMLSGDKHCYARYEPVDAAPGAGCTKIVAGGGGAYLAGTQDLEDRVRIREATDPRVSIHYELERAWPGRNVARGVLAWSAPIRVWRHWSVSLVIALLYLLLAAFVRIGAADGVDTAAAIEKLGKLGWSDAFGEVVSGSARSVTFWIFVIILWIALAGVALAWQQGRKLPELRAHWVWGFVHAAIHVGAVVVLTTTALVVAWKVDGETSWRAVYYYLLLLAASYVVGTAIYALYLAVAQHRKRSVWALFPMLAHEGWKNFLRIRVTDEELTVYALGAQRVPKNRKVTWDADGELHVTPAECAWTLIDTVTVPHDATGPS